MNADELVRCLIEDSPDDVSPKDELLRLPGWRERIVRHEEYEFLSDRWGEELEAGVGLPAIHSRPEEEVAVIQHLQACLGEYENNFIVQRIADKRYGILFESEFLNPESDEAEKAQYKNIDGTPVVFDEVAQDLLHTMSKMERRFPQAEFSISVGEHVFLERFVVRAFVPDGVITPDLSQQMSEAFSQL